MKYESYLIKIALFYSFCFTNILRFLNFIIFSGGNSSNLSTNKNDKNIVNNSLTNAALPTNASLSANSGSVSTLTADNVANTTTNSKNISKVDMEAMEEMIFPPGSNPDHSPLHVVCCNDTCSFTWTGAEHINQVSSVSNLSNICCKIFVNIHFFSLAFLLYTGCLPVMKVMK